MPTYFFHLADKEVIEDPDGTDLADLAEAREHAAEVARELTFRSAGIFQRGWSNWTLRVQDEHGTDLFSLMLSDYGSRVPKA
jgi:hypothetical protein